MNVPGKDAAQARTDPSWRAPVDLHTNAHKVHAAPLPTSAAVHGQHYLPAPSALPHYLTAHPTPST